MERITQRSKRHVDLDHDRKHESERLRLRLKPFELLDRIDDDTDRPALFMRPMERSNVGGLYGRISDQHVPKPGVDQVLGLLGGVGHHALDQAVRPVDQVLDQPQAPDRLRRDPKPLVRPANRGKERIGVSVERVEIHQRERQALTLDRAAEAAIPGFGRLEHRGSIASIGLFDAPARPQRPIKTHRDLPRPMLIRTLQNSSAFSVRPPEPKARRARTDRFERGPDGRTDDPTRRSLEPAKAAPVDAKTEAAIAAKRAAQDDRAFLEDLVAAYYPIAHPNLHVTHAPINLDTMKVGRTDETGRLRKVALSVPFALGGEWKFSPLAADKGFDFNLDKALEQHAALTKHLLDRGVEVYLTLQDPNASEAVYATDTVTGIGRTAFVGNPKHAARKLETKSYEGGVRLEKFGGEAGPIEFGDVQLFEKDGVQYVFQGLNSMRATEQSISAMRHALEYLKRRGDIGEFEHIPVELTGDGTLHLDYVFNYAGRGDARVMTIFPEGLADPALADRLAQILEVPPERVIRVNKGQMLAGAANLSSYSPDEVLYIDNEFTRPIAEKMRSFGLEVSLFPYDQMSQKDGTLHCSIGQLARD